MALKIFCRKIAVNDGSLAVAKGPLLIVANHPDSFLDAVIIGSRFSQPVHFLARGDAFRKPWHSRLLGLLNMIPVYRLSEGKENLALNGEAFRRSKEVLSQNGIVLIFIEGISVNKHELQPFKKGAARIALESRENPHLQVMPLGIAYNSFERMGKRVIINIARPIPVLSLLPFEEDAKNSRHFNEVIFEELKNLIAVPGQNLATPQKQSVWRLLPGIAGYILHVPFYTLLRNTIKKKTAGTIFFDSVLFGALLLLYPVYLLVLCVLLGFFHVPLLLIALVFIAHPFLAWSAVRLKSKK